MRLKIEFKLNVFKTEPTIESEKLLVQVHWSDWWSNRVQTGDIINLYFIILYIIKI